MPLLISIKYQHMAFVTPVEIRRLRAQMELKNLSLKEISERTGIGYSNCSLILSGRLNDPVKLRAIKSAIRKAKAPEMQPA